MWLPSEEPQSFVTCSHQPSFTRTGQPEPRVRVNRSQAGELVKADWGAGDTLMVILILSIDSDFGEVNKSLSNRIRISKYLRQ